MSDVVQQIKDSIDIADYISRHLKLEKRGQNFFGLCPFHNEKTPSFSVSTTLQRYKCFGCDASGDIFNFVQDYQRVDFPEALEILAQEAGIEIKDIKYSDKDSKIKKQLYKIYSRVSDYYNKVLFANIGKEALNYLHNRGITDKSIKNFQIGYAPNQRNFIVKQLLKEYDKEVIKLSGLLKPDRFEDKFVDRILFTIFDNRGRPIAFTARVFRDGDSRPKYLNTPETYIFQKRKILFGLYHGANSVNKEENAILLEGTTDVISNHQVGIKNVLAPLGTSLTLEQLESLKKYTNIITFAFDNDRAGQMALIRGSNLAHEAGFAVKAIKIPYGKDSDEAIRHDVNLWKKAIVDAKPVILHIIESIGINSFNEKKKALAIVIPMIKRIIDPVLRDSYVNLISNKFSISTKSVYQLIDSEVEIINKETVEKLIKKNEQSNISEIYYIALLLQNKQFQRDKFLISSKYLQNDNIKNLFSLLQKEKFNQKKVKELISDDEVQKVYDEATFYKLPVDDLDVLMKDLLRLIHSFKIRYVKGKIYYYSCQRDEDKVNKWIKKLAHLQNKE